MLTEVELKELPSFQLGMERGYEQGIEYGYEQASLYMVVCLRKNGMSVKVVRLC